MKILLLSLMAGITVSASAQFYYNDIVATEEINQVMRNYVANKVRTISATGYDSKNSVATDFSEYSEIRDNGRTVKLSGVVNRNRKLNMYRYDDQYRIISMSDSLTAIRNNTTYTYDATGRVTRVQNVVEDSASFFNQVETHTWVYNAAGKPEKMWRVVLNPAISQTADTLEVRFLTDEDGNVGEERSFRRGVETAFVYYYYDDNNRLSDVVRYNKKLDRLIPDIMFEHDAQGRVIQKITTTSDRVVGYLIWRYIFDDKGLKTKEALFNNDKQLTGKIEYAYTFGN